MTIGKYLPYIDEFVKFSVFFLLLLEHKFIKPENNNHSKYGNDESDY